MKVVTVARRGVGVLQGRGIAGGLGPRGGRRAEICAARTADAWVAKGCGGGVWVELGRGGRAWGWRQRWRGMDEERGEEVALGCWGCVKEAWRWRRLCWGVVGVRMAAEAGGVGVGEREGALACDGVETSGVEKWKDAVVTKEVREVREVGSSGVARKAEGSAARWLLAVCAATLQPCAVFSYRRTGCDCEGVRWLGAVRRGGGGVAGVWTGV